MRGIFAGMVLVLGGLIGCDAVPPGGGTGAGGGSKAEPAAADGHKSYAIADLPDVEETALPAADQGRVVITLPAGWKPLVRNPKFLVACIPEDSSASKLPRITVSVSEPTIDDKTSVTADNVQEFAAKLQAQMQKEDKKTVESAKPLMLGENAWARHVRRVSFSDGPAAIQALQTIRSGRLYTVELTVTAKDNPRKSTDLFYKNTLKAHRDFAYAVAANMKFPKDGGSAPATTEPATPAEEKPSTEKPAAEPAKSE